MFVPGSNLLSMALGVIRPQLPQLRKWTGRALGPTGLFVDTYDEPVNVVGSFQPIDRRAYQQLGLDLSKNYSILYTSTPIQCVAPDVAGDLVEFGGKTHQAESEMDWKIQDGWGSYTFVEVVPND